MKRQLTKWRIAALPTHSILILFLWAAIGMHSLRSQDLFYARVSKTEMTADDRVRVDFVLKQKESDFTPPPFKDFYVIMGPSVSQSFSWINGRSSYTKTYTYILQPKRTGILEIEPARAVIQGKEYFTEPVKITVDKSENPPPAATGPAPAPPREKNATAEGKDIFLTLELTKTKPYVNEAVGGIYKLYIKQGIDATNFQITTLPEYKGFWVEKLSDKFEGPYMREINGVPYEVYNVSKIVLFPQQAGVLKIKPLKAKITKITYRQEILGGFFAHTVEVPQIKELSSGVKIIRVKPLPEEGKPVDFSGAVGKFDLRLFMDKDSVKVGQSVSLRLKVNGRGNLGLIDLPDLQLPPDLEVFEPEIKRNYKPTLYGFRGSIEKIFTVIPQKSGKYIIPAVKFSYFDPETGKYHTLETRERLLHVTGTGLSLSSSPKGNVTADSGLEPLAESGKWLSVRKTRFFGGKWYVYATLLPFVILLLARLFKTYRDRRLSRPEVLHRKRVQSELNRLLRQAEGATDDKEKFYGLLEKILFTYFKEKMHLRPVEVTRDAVIKRLQKQGVADEILSRLEDLWQKIAAARYTPAGSAVMRDDLENVKQLLRELDKLS